MSALNLLIELLIFISQSKFVFGTAIFSKNFMNVPRYNEGIRADISIKMEYN